MSDHDLACKVIVDDALTGRQNMTVDAEMLALAASGKATVRTYQWSEPTVSLGHFQAKTVGDVPERFSRLAVVERLSGGGAILHDQELTYSLALPNTHPLTKTPSQIYNVVHQSIIELLDDYGVRSQMRGNAAFSDKPFLCFGRGDERDIVIGENKIVGSAQRRRQGAVLQHGSLLLRRSTHASEFEGIEELTGVRLPTEVFASKLRESILRCLGLTADVNEVPGDSSI